MTYDVIIRDGLWFDGTGSTPQTRTLGIRDGVVATVSSTGRWTRPAAPRSSTRRASGSCPASSTCTPTTTPRCCWTPDCASRCATVSPRCCWACARCRRSTPTPRTPPTCSAGSRRCRASTSSAALQANKTWSTPAEYVEAIDAPAAGPECQLAAWSFGSADRGARVSIAPPTRAVEPTDAELRQDGGVARRRARGRDARHVRDGRGDRQARRRPLPVACAAVHLRDVA